MESTFKYIFALIVGALFIVFFVRFAMNYASTAQTFESSMIAKNFDDYLEITSTFQNGMNIIDFGSESPLSFRDGKIRSGTGIAQSTERIVYSPVNLKGIMVVIWTNKLEFPYAIDNLFYLTNEKYRYYLVYDRDTQEFVEEMMDGTIPGYFKEKNYMRSFEVGNLKMDDIKKSHGLFANVRFICFSSSVADKVKKKISDAGMGNADLLLITPEGEDDGEWKVGNVNYMMEKDAEGTFLGQPMMFGAFFAEDFKTYGENMEKVYERMVQITDIYIEKADFMSDALGMTKSCDEYSFFKAQHLTPYRQMIEDRKDVSSMLAKANDMEKDNRREFGTDCPSIF